ncbi:MAG: hypothetical protein ACTS73_04425 [Arsenophonus sp. NEOnobi-MAG3]
MPLIKPLMFCWQAFQRSIHPAAINAVEKRSTKNTGILRLPVKTLVVK